MKHAIYILFIFILLLSCQISTDKEKSSNIAKKMIKENKTEAVCPALFIKLKSFVAYTNITKKEHTSECDVYLVEFYKDGTDCYVKISQSLWYYDSCFCKQSFSPDSLNFKTTNIDGYILMKNKMLAFYGLKTQCKKNDCYKGLVDTTKLQNEYPNKFPEFSDIPKTIFDPIGEIFKIHSRDSLELVYFGAL